MEFSHPTVPRPRLVLGLGLGLALASTKVASGLPGGGVSGTILYIAYLLWPVGLTVFDFLLRSVCSNINATTAVSAAAPFEHEPPAARLQRPVSLSLIHI